MTTALSKQIENYSNRQLLELTEMVYAQVRATVVAGTATQEDIRACNDARRVIKECKQLGMGA